MVCEAAGGNVGGDETPTPTLSPRSKMKFLCSYGGKILPRPTDGHLKYVGGETRVIAIRRVIKFSDLMKKLTALFDGDFVLKYQLVPEDLDVLVSVRSDEDLKHMLDEYDRLESEGTPKLRCFLFPLNPIVVETHPFSGDPHAIEQRYLEAINGIVRSGSTANTSARLSPTPTNRPTFSISSACSSPKSSSPDGQTVESVAQETSPWNSMKPSRPPMHKVHSSPSLCSFNNLQPPPIIIPVTKHHIPRHCNYQQNQMQQYHNGHQSQRPTGPERVPMTLSPSPSMSRADFAPERVVPMTLSPSPSMSRADFAPERVVPMTLSPSPSMSRADFGRGPMVAVAHNFSHHTSSRQQRGMGGWTKYGYSDQEFAVNGCARLDRSESSQWSPRMPFWE